MSRFESFRAQYPSLSRTHNGNTLVFMDGPGGTQVPQSVIDAVSSYYKLSNANAHGPFITSQETDVIIQGARQRMSDFLGAEGPHTISFGSNMTTINFALSRAMSRVFQPGDEVLITQLDHESNRGPWLALRAQGIIVKEVRLLKNGYLDYEDLVKKVNDRTRLIAMGYGSNFMGTVNNIAIAREQAYRVGAWLLIDAVHYAPHFPIDVMALGCDFLLCSAYKFYGPHVGILYSKPGLLDQLPTDRLRTAPQTAPGSIETGTFNHAALAGVSAAVDEIAELGEDHKDKRQEILLGMQAIQAHERALLETLHQGLIEIPGVRIIGPDLADQRRTPTLAVVAKNQHPKDIPKALAADNICAWNGHFYALRASEVLGLQEKGGVVRLGLSAYSNLDDVNRVIQSFQKIMKQ
ncbi:MAG: cysteine desulfurase-like protein [Bacteroidota bacterium]